MIKRLINIFYFKFEIFFSYFPFFAELFIKFHEFSVKGEIELYQISPSEKVLHIGCGAIPYTSIVVARETNAKIIAIDNKHKMVNAATNLIKRCNLSDRIKIEFGDGNTYDLSSFDVIFLSFGVTCQELILKHVIDSMKDKSRIYLRVPKKMKDDYVNSIVGDFSVCSKQSLLTQESILIFK
jgi:trans-aconitate methyltransferase